MLMCINIYTYVSDYFINQLSSGVGNNIPKPLRKNQFISTLRTSILHLKFRDASFKNLIHCPNY